MAQPAGDTEAGDGNTSSRPSGSDPAASGADIFYGLQNEAHDPPILNRESRHLGSFEESAILHSDTALGEPLRRMVGEEYVRATGAFLTDDAAAGVAGRRLVGCTDREVASLVSSTRNM